MSIEHILHQPHIPPEVLLHPELVKFGLAAFGIVIAARWAYNAWKPASWRQI